jgi:hypothetical protein
MPKLAIRDWSPLPVFEAKIDLVNDIIAEYRASGFNLTLRQVYYQMVARDLIPNSLQSYKNLGSLIDKARWAGYIDWEAIEDRTRNYLGHGYWEWDDPGQYLDAAADSYTQNRWMDQPYHVEVWVEKEALIDVVRRAVNYRDGGYFACRGNVSSPEIYNAARRYEDAITRRDKNVLVLHLGDHDPNGIDMSRDNDARLTEILDHQGVDLDRFEFRRIALNMDQVRQYNPPPNPAKSTDSRYGGYIERFGGESWELDALPPQVLVDLIRSEIDQVVDMDRWRVVERREEEGREDLRLLSRNYDHLLEVARDRD